MDEQKPADKLKEIAAKMRYGALAYEEAHAEAKPIIDAMNKRMKELAKENGVPFKKVSFTHFTR